LAWAGGRNQFILCVGHKTWGIGLGWGKKLNYSMCWTQDMGVWGWVRVRNKIFYHSWMLGNRISTCA